MPVSCTQIKRIPLIFLYIYIQSNHCIENRNELHFDKMHACFMLRSFFNFDQLLYWHFHTISVHCPTIHDSIAIKYLYAVYMFKFVWSFPSKMCLLSNNNRHVSFTEKIFLCFDLLIFPINVVRQNHFEKWRLWERNSEPLSCHYDA